ncbi:LysR family transcriptional regulator [Pseudohaliea sp.]|uniref:LysR family transcriptional regulator n=1 Tax=Pseudohaliea sp. TaxID=2740289 RepID=UPI0032ED153E
MDRFEAMAMLVTVTEEGSLSAAARRLHVPLATLSRKVSDLEKLLGARLLIRTTRKLTLTDVGAAYVAAARRILEDVEHAEREAAGEYTTPRGELTLTAPVMFGRLHVLPLVAQFLATWPAINVRLSFTDRNVDIVEDHVDLAVRISQLPDSTMIATQVGEMRTVTCASPALLAEHGSPERPDDLRRLPCVTVDAPILSPSWRYRVPGGSAVIEVPVASRLSLSSTEAVAEAAIQGVGVARLLHYQAARGLANGALQTVLEDYEPGLQPVHLVHVSRGQMPLKMRCFLDFAVPRLREALKTAGGHQSP